MAEHRELPGTEAHKVYRQIFADDAARLADPGPYLASELNIKAFQVDTNTEYRLTATTPTWAAIGAGGGGGVTDLQGAYDGGGSVALDVDGGNNLVFDSVPADPLGMGLFAIKRDQGAGESTLLKAPAQVDDSATPGTALILVTGSGSNQVTVGTGQSGTNAGNLILGGIGAASPGGLGSAASGSGTPGAVGGDGGILQLVLANGGAGGAGSGADAAGGGGTSGAMSISGSSGGKGGAAGVTGAAGNGGAGSSGTLQGGAGGDGGDGTAAGVAGNGAPGAEFTVQAGSGGVAGGDGGGGGADGGNGGVLVIQGGDAGAASGAGTDGTAGGLNLDAGALAGTGALGDVNIGAFNAETVRIGRAAGNVAFFGGGGTSIPTITGAKGGNAALASLLTALANLNLIVDSTTA